MAKPRILIVDDEPDLSSFVAEVAEEAGYETAEANDPWKGLEYLSQNEVDVIALDLLMPQMDGIEFIRHLAQRYYVDQGLILMTGFDKSILKAAEQTAKERKLQVHATVTKPVRMAELMTTLEDIADKIGK